MEEREESQLLQTELVALDRTPIELASQMSGWGDHRPHATIVRSIQRMMAGDTSVSGEMKVIINMMLYQQHLDELAYGDLQWHEHSNGSWSAKTSDFTISLSPQTKGRWHISIVHKDGYSHPWPTWQNSLEAAKRKALICLGDARRHVWEYQREESQA